MPGLEVVSASRRSDSSALIGGGGGVEEPLYQNSHENSPLASFQVGRGGRQGGVGFPAPTPGLSLCPWDSTRWPPSELER